MDPFTLWAGLVQQLMAAMCWANWQRRSPERRRRP